jgi:hypothetical protein
MHKKRAGRGNLPNRLFGETTVPSGSSDEGGEERDDGGEMQEDVLRKASTWLQNGGEKTKMIYYWNGGGRTAPR